MNQFKQVAPSAQLSDNVEKLSVLEHIVEPYYRVVVKLTKKEELSHVLISHFVVHQALLQNVHRSQLFGLTIITDSLLSESALSDKLSKIVGAEKLPGLSSQHGVDLVTHKLTEFLMEVFFSVQLAC